MCSGQCPICYEDFDLSQQRLIPRQLTQCHDVICWGCLQEAIFEKECYCPQCGTLHAGSTVQEVSEPRPEHVPRADSELLSSQESQSPPPEEISFADNLMSSPPKTRDRCQMEGCHRRAGIGSEDGYCLKHSTSKKRSSLMKETEIAESLKATSLGQVSIDGTKFKLMAPIVAGSTFQPDDLIERFSRQSRMELGEVMTLIDKAKEIMTPEPNVLRLVAPVVVVGDIHGQFYDLVNMLKVGGPVSGDSSKQYLFLGDYVDRGHFSCEVMLLLLSLKYVYPKQIWLLRGNHECRSVSGHFGFKEECKKKYGVAVYYNFLLMFQTMPLAAIVSTEYGNIFACHGGISPSLNLLEDIESLDRFVEPEVNSGLLDMLWSDPVHDSNVLPADYDEEAEEEYHKYLAIDWRPNPTRGCSYCFGYAAIVTFLQKNNFVCLLRAHEVQEEGFHEHFQSVIVTKRVQLTSPRAHSPLAARIDTSDLGPTPPSAEDPYVCLSSEVSGSGQSKAYSEMLKCLPLVITVFSAPNYCDRYDNKAAILTIGQTLRDFQFIQYDCVEHPVPDDIENEMNNQIAAVVASCPYMPTSFQDFVRLAIELGFENDLFEDETFQTDDGIPALGLLSSCETNLVHAKDGVDQSIPELSQSQVWVAASQPLELQSHRVSTTDRTVGIAMDRNLGIGDGSNSIHTFTPSTPSPLSGTPATGIGEVGTPPLSPSFVYPNRRPSLPSPLFKSNSLYTVSSNGPFTPDTSLRNTSPAVPIYQRPSTSKAPSESNLFSPPRRVSMSSPYSARKALVPEGYVRQRINNIESLNIEVVDSPGNVKSDRTKVDMETPLNSRKESKSQSTQQLSKWRERRTSAPARRQSVILSSTIHMRGNSLILPSTKLDSDDDTNYSASTNNTPASLMARRNLRRSSYGSDVSDLSPPLLVSPQSAPSIVPSVGNVSPLVPAALIPPMDKADRRVDIPAVVKFDPEPKNNSSKKQKRQSFAMASAYDAIYERHPKTVLDHLQGIEKATDMMLASNLGEEISYVGSMDEIDRVETQDIVSDGQTGHSTSSGAENDSGTAKNSKPFTRTSIGNLFPAMAMEESANASEASGLHAPVLSDIAGLNLQAPDIIELLDDHGHDRRSFTDTRPRLTEQSESMQKTVVFTREELLGLRLMFSLFDRTGNGFIEYEDLVAYAEETGDFMRLRDASLALDILDIDGDGSIGLLDFIHFASRLQRLYSQGMLNTSSASVAGEEQLHPHKEA